LGLFVGLFATTYNLLYNALIYPCCS
jgi:hypothetical protein